MQWLLSLLTTVIIPSFMLKSLCIFCIIARFEETISPDEVVCIVAHLDSISGLRPIESHAPGANEDGSGTATTLDAFLALVEG